ncbi:MAG: oligoendopeptidase F [Clostridia bacterium]|nr:oligoendopeptidase F [Clostridia bacterium]
MEKLRKEMDPKFCWNLKDIFESNAAWEEALASVSAMVEEIPAVAGTLGASKEALKAGLDKLYAAAEALDRVYVYTFLYSSGDNGDPVAQEMEEKATRLYVAFSTHMAFLSPEILAIDPEKLEKWIAEPDMANYRFMIRDICRARTHTLSENEEKLLAMLGDAAQTPKKTFDLFESVDMSFPALSDGQPLTHGLFGKYRESADPAIRKEAFEKYFGEYRKYINTVASLYSGSVKLDCYYAKVRNYPSALEGALYANDIPKSLYENLITCVREGIPAMERYLEIRRKLLGMDKLSLYDLYVPLIEDVDAEVPFEEAKRMVKEALKPLGEEYQALLDRAYSEQWIDVYENKGKTTGAYSCGVYGVHPYVLLNYSNKYDDAFTLAHELGHSMHSWYSSQNQDYVNHDYTIFVAEVASTVNEVLMSRYLLSIEKDEKKRAYILNHLLEHFRTTVFRQTLFAEFEKKVHEMYEAGEPLTVQSLDAVYHDLNAAYYPICESTPETDSEWARIPHFYRAFYVYQYATGFCSAVAIADRILNHNGAEDYLKFLSTGGSMYPIDELKIAGVDLTSPEPIRSALKVFEETLDEFAKLMNV